MSEEAVVLTHQDAPEVEAPQVNAEVSGGETPAVDPQANANEGENEQKEHKRTGGFQRKIQKLEEQNEQLLAAQVGKAGEAPKAGPPQAEADEPEPQPADFRIGETDEFDSVACRKAERAWDRKQLVKEVEARLSRAEQAKAAQTEEEKARESWNQRKAAATVKNADFPDVAKEALSVFKSNLTDSLDAVSGAISEHELGAAILYELGKNPGEIERLAGLSRNAALMELGLIAARLAGQEPAADQGVSHDSPPMSKAPVPVKTVSRPSSASHKPDPLSPQADYADFEKEMNKRQYGK
jgi:hypothetical protein